MECLICNRINKIKLGKNPYFVKELEAGYVVLGDHQFYKGYTLFLSKIHKEELHELDPKTRKKFLEEMSFVAEAVWKAFKPNKLNYELLGNSHPHLHWHIFPRYTEDEHPTEAIWRIPKELRASKEKIPSRKELEYLKQLLLEQL